MLCFWTKNPEAILTHLETLADYNYYVQVTVTGYQKTLEMGVPTTEKVIRHIAALAECIGKERIIWRYDPIILSNKMTLAWHLAHYESLCQQLSSYVNHCVISFLDVYDKIKTPIDQLGVRSPTFEEINGLGEGLAQIGKQYDLKLQTCGEIMDLSAYGIEKGSCIDNMYIGQLLGQVGSIPKDKGQRSSCRCVKSVDIGMYNTCPHGCIYCYANWQHKKAMDHHRHHDPKGSLLFGTLSGDEKIYPRKVEKYFEHEQLSWL